MPDRSFFQKSYSGKLTMRQQMDLMQGFIELVGEIQASGCEHAHEYLRELNVSAEKGFDTAIVAHSVAWRLYNRIIRQVLDQSDNEYELRERLEELLERVRQ